jgi:hypothetical protein
MRLVTGFQLGPCEVDCLIGRGGSAVRRRTDSLVIPPVQDALGGVVSALVTDRSSRGPDEVLGFILSELLSRLLEQQGRKLAVDVLGFAGTM